MVENQSGYVNNKNHLLIQRMLFFCAVIFFLFLLFLYPSDLSQAVSLQRAAVDISQYDNTVYIPLVYRQYSISLAETATPTSTPTPTSTATPTATGTPATSTPTPTGTPPTSTPTSTSTSTGTPPTPTWTATGTITPNPRLSMTVSPFQANVGDNFTFTIEVTNIGSAPANNVILTDSFPDFIDVISVTTSKGTASKSIHSASVNIGSVVPGEKINITIVVRANSRKLTSETVINTITLYYDSDGIKTASASYRIIVTTLPGTGELPLDWQDVSNKSLLTIQVLLMLGLGIVLTSLGVWAWKRNSTNRFWMLGIGFILLIVSLFTILTEIRDNSLTDPLEIVQVVDQSRDTEGISQDPQPFIVTPSLKAHPPAYIFATPEHIVVETLPSYPVPSPSISFTPVPEIEVPDTSSVKRIAIPAILLDTEVKYVPFDGTTWLIRGLRYEVAWLGDTSWPGLGSNTVLAGHVTVRGIGNGPFRRLEELANGEFIFLYTEKNTYSYRVSGRNIVEDWDLSVVQPSDSPQLTLITCVEWDEELEMYLKRLVLFAELVRVDPVFENNSNY